MSSAAASAYRQTYSTPADSNWLRSVTVANTAGSERAKVATRSGPAASIRLVRVIVPVARSMMVRPRAEHVVALMLSGALITARVPSRLTLGS